MLSKVKESEGFHEILDFLKESHISYALTVKTKNLFWANTIVLGKYNSEWSRRWEANKIHCVWQTHSDQRSHQSHLLTSQWCWRYIFSFQWYILWWTQTMGYEGPLDKFTFYKGFFSPQRNFLIHTIKQCLSQNRTSWNEFSSTIPTAIVCLATS